MSYNLYITVDTNDGDYLTQESTITKEQFETILPVIAAIKNFKTYTVKLSDCSMTHSNNFPYGELIRTDIGELSAEQHYGHIPGFETFESFLPYNEWGFHSIVNIKMYPSESTINLF